MTHLSALVFSGLFILSSNAFACRFRTDCMLYNGQEIDLRSNVARELDTLKENCEIKGNCEAVFGQSESRPLTIDEMNKLLGSEGSRYFIPLDIRNRDLIMIAGALSLGTVIFNNDREIMDFVQEHRSEKTQMVANVGNIMGREAIAPIAAGSYFLGVVMSNKKMRKVGLFTVGAGLATQIVTEAFKKTTNRIRPNESDSPYDFFEEGNNSFFSGHTSAAFSLATVVSHVYRDKPIVPFVAYGVATLTAYARMHENKHWASDVLMGAVAGHLVTKIMIRTLENTSLGQATSGFEISPVSIVSPEIDEPLHGIQIRWKGQPKKTKRKMKCNESGLVGRDLMRLCISEIPWHG